MHCFKYLKKKLVDFLKGYPFAISLVLFVINLIKHFFSFKNANKFTYNRLKSHITTQNKDFIILGSGQSINELNNDDIDYLAENISIGVGRWIYHSFIPNLYFLEVSEEPKMLDWLDDFAKLLNARKKDYANVLIIFDGATKSPLIRNRIFKSIANELHCNILFSKTIIPPTGDINYFYYTIKLFRLFKFVNFFNITLHCRSSVVLSAVMGLNLDFKKIILIGVDGYTGYFQPWDNPVFHSDYGGLEKNKNHSLHSTSNPKFGLPTVPECFYLLNERFIKIEIFTRNTILYPKLQVSKKKIYNSNNIKS